MKCHRIRQNEDKGQCIYKYLGEKKIDEKKASTQVDYSYSSDEGMEILIEQVKREQIEAEKAQLREYFKEITSRDAKGFEKLNVCMQR